MEQKQRRTTEQMTGQRDSAERQTPRRPRADSAYAGDRPSNAAQEGGLLRELKETPRHLD